jgi:peptidyl-prolyl cis-trans isomerase C
MSIPVSAGSPVRLRQFGFCAALLALLVMTAGPAGAQDKDPVVAKVNGIEIHQSDLAVAEDEPGQIPPMSPEATQD